MVYTCTEIDTVIDAYDEAFPGKPFPTMPNLPMPENEAIATMKQCIADGKPWTNPNFDPNVDY